MEEHRTQEQDQPFAGSAKRKEPLPWQAPRLLTIPLSETRNSGNHHTDTASPYTNNIS